MSQETFEIIKTLLNGADGALIIVLLYTLNQARAWTRRVDTAIENLERLNKIVEDNQADILKLRRMFFALKDQVTNVQAKDASG